MKKICVIVDAGHGGNHPITGEYMTPKVWGKFYRFLKSAPSKATTLTLNVIGANPKKVAGGFVLIAVKLTGGHTGNVMNIGGVYNNLLALYPRIRVKRISAYNGITDDEANTILLNQYL
jgi:hypothetical protein